MKKTINRSTKSIASSFAVSFAILSLIALISVEYQKEQTLLAKNNHETQNSQH
jgi:hypothetical protein